MTDRMDDDFKLDFSHVGELCMVCGEVPPKEHSLFCEACQPVDNIRSLFIAPDAHLSVENTLNNLTWTVPEHLVNRISVFELDQGEEAFAMPFCVVLIDGEPRIQGYSMVSMTKNQTFSMRIKREGELILIDQQSLIEGRLTPGATPEEEYLSFPIQVVPEF